MNQVFGTNPTAQRLLERKAEKVEKPTVVAEVKDYHGDNWKLLKGVVHSEKHPHYMKQTDKGIKRSPFNVWHNTRTDQVHEGDMLFRSDGTASPHVPSYDGQLSHPHTYHISHYKKAKALKEETVKDANKYTGRSKSGAPGSYNTALSPKIRDMLRQSEQARKKKSNEETEVDEGWAERPHKRTSKDYLGAVNIKGEKPESAHDIGVMAVAKALHPVRIKYRGAPGKRAGGGPGKTRNWWGGSYKQHATGADMYVDNRKNWKKGTTRTAPK